MNIKTDGIIIREQNTGEADRLVTILTRDSGLIRAFVRGAKNIKNKQLSSTQLLCYSNLTLYHGRDSYIVDNAEAIELFFDLRNDIGDLSLALYLAELSAELAPQEEDASAYLRLLLNALYLLMRKKRDPLIIKAVVEMQELSLSGYMPDLTACAHCGAFESDAMYFNFLEGILCCEHCRNGSEGTRISAGVIASMRYILYAQLDKAFDFKLSQDGEKELSAVVERYLITQTQRKYKTLDFYHSVAM